MDGFQIEVLSHLPLAEGIFHLFSHVLDHQHLGQMFESHRGRCYERDLSFAEVVYLPRDALLVHEGSGNASFCAAKEADALPVAVKNVYEKLGRLPLELSLALLRETAVKLAELLPPVHDPLPASLAGLVVIAFDGKKIKKAAKRLKALRGLPGKMLGGKLLAAMHVRQGHFLLRCTTALTFHPDPQRAAQEGTDARGRRWVQQWGWIGSPRDKRRRYLRQITLYRPEEKDDVILITDLTDPTLYPAEDLLAAYLLRWEIECMFQKVTEVFDLQKLIGSTPQAMIFQSAFCFVLYNLIEVVRAYVAQGAKRPVGEVSTEKLFDSVCRQLGAWSQLGEPAHAAAYFQPTLQAKPLKQKLTRLLGNLWTERWLKSRNKKPRPAKPKARVKPGHGGHSSVWRVLQASKQSAARP